jgi:hypothetical protein
MRATSVTVLVAAVLAGACQAPSRESASASGEAGSPAPAAGASAKARASARQGGSGLASGLIDALKPEPLLIPAGTTLPLVLETTVSSGTNSAGDGVVARLVSDVTSGQKVLLAAGTLVRGHVTAAVPSGRVKGRARLAVSFDSVAVKGREHQLATRAVDITAEDSHKRDAAIVGGGAAAGGIIGAIAGGKKGAGKGVLIGGAAGAGTVLATKGREVTLVAGTTLEIELVADTRLD